MSEHLAKRPSIAHHVFDLVASRLCAHTLAYPFMHVARLDAQRGARHRRVELVAQHFSFGGLVVVGIYRHVAAQVRAWSLVSCGTSQRETPQRCRLFEHCAEGRRALGKFSGWSCARVCLWWRLGVSARCELRVRCGIWRLGSDPWRAAHSRGFRFGVEYESGWLSSPGALLFVLRLRRLLGGLAVVCNRCRCMLWLHAG